MQLVERSWKWHSEEGMLHIIVGHTATIRYNTRHQYDTIPESELLPTL